LKASKRLRAKKSLRPAAETTTKRRGREKESERAAKSFAAFGLVPELNNRFAVRAKLNL